MSEEKEKTLLCIENMVDGTRVSLHTESADDMYTLVVALAKLLYDHPVVMVGTLSTLKELSEDEDLNEQIDKETIDLKKFDDILKSSKSN